MRTDGEAQRKDRGTLGQTREVWQRRQAVVKGKWDTMPKTSLLIVTALPTVLL